MLYVDSHAVGCGCADEGYSVRVRRQRSSQKLNVSKSSHAQPTVGVVRISSTGSIINKANVISLRRSRAGLGIQTVTQGSETSLKIHRLLPSTSCCVALCHFLSRSGGGGRRCGWSCDLPLTDTSSISPASSPQIGILSIDLNPFF